MTATLRRLMLTALLLPLLRGAAAQEGFSKDGLSLYSIGLGYDMMADAYSSDGFALEVRARFYTSERMFCELTGHWGTHGGEKNITQQGQPMRLKDNRDSLLGAVGLGFDVVQTGDKRFCAYVKGQLGYGARAERYDDYDPNEGESGRIMLQRSNDKSGIAAIVGAGVDWRHLSWTLTPAAEAIYVGGKLDVALTLSVGLFLY